MHNVKWTQKRWRPASACLRSDGIAFFTTDISIVFNPIGLQYVPTTKKPILVVAKVSKTSHILLK